jgi:hypothetical protein
MNKKLINNAIIQISDEVKKQVIILFQKNDIDIEKNKFNDELMKKYAHIISVDAIFFNKNILSTYFIIDKVRKKVVNAIQLIQKGKRFEVKILNKESIDCYNQAQKLAKFAESNVEIKNNNLKILN